MNTVASLDYSRGSFLYITNPLWKHAQRSEKSKSNLILVTEGVLYIKIHGTKYEVRPNELIYLPHGESSIGYRPSGTNTGFFYVLFNANEPLDLPTHFTVTDIDTVHALFSQLIHHTSYYNLPHIAINTLMHALFYELKYQLSAPADTLSNHDKLSDNIKRYLLRSVNRNLTLNDVAAHFEMSTDHVSRVFRESEHMSMKDYMNSLKIRQIQKYLVSPNNTLIQIATIMNFPSADALSKFYKYHTGETPEVYRSRVKYNNL